MLPPARKRAKVGWGPYMMFQSSQMETARAVARASDLTDNSGLTEDARTRVIANAKASWAQMSATTRRVAVRRFSFSPVGQYCTRGSFLWQKK